MSRPDSRPGPELHYLEAFHTVCIEGGMSAAARALGCSQPAVSYQIRKLETALGVRLLERAGRRIVLTPEGRRFRSFTERVLTDLAHVRSECAAGQSLEPLRLGAASGFGRYVLLPVLHRLREEQPDPMRFEVRVEYDAADLVLDRLEAGDYEAAFVYKRTVTNTLVFAKAYEEELVLIGQPRATPRPGSAILRRIDRLERLPFVTYEECEYVFGRWFETCFGSQPSRLTSSSHFTELEEVIDFVRRGVGLSIVPRDAAERAAEDGDIIMLRAGSRDRCLNPVYRVMRSGSEPRPLLDRLTALLRDGPHPVSMVAPKPAHS